MRGTSLLAMPWAFSQAGLSLGLILGIVISVIAASTALAILKLHRHEESKLKMGKLYHELRL